MKANPSPMSVADYCHDFNNGKVKVNEEYQRNTGLWTAQARSFFIESILLEYPIPKLYLHARLDLKSRQQIKEVVDGQQRTQALVSFFNNQQRLTKNIDTDELRGLKYSQLSDEWQSRFLSYSLPIDQFSGAPDDEVREAFRRMNANNVPLNDEEQRNARFQGPFKWFIVQLADRYKNVLGKIGLFSRRDLIRMSDLKLYAEIILALDSGFTTVKGKQIDDLYKKYNASFAKEDDYTEIVVEAIDQFLNTDALHDDSLLRAHIFQSLILALIELKHPGRVVIPQTDEVREIEARAAAKKVPISALVAALRSPEDYSELAEFLDASTQKTNVERSKIVRFLYLKASLSLEE
ncbi:DUF262 domain-containing protein [Rhizobium leguminosarum]|uniref:DUF262 domain-containing protein n=1 Tax=Rhizobium leguminosarum TaxID=384 RepID=UPI001C93995A|nr:DUF262 domain-containing protein [Rhizobium leguminosarum]MBY5326531.1 DUF262 domain-containing protein [Rhizobium leguminosarum]